MTIAPLPTALFSVSAVLPLAAEMPDPASASSIGWLLLAAGGLFMALNQGADFIARFRKREPRGTEIIGQPLEIKHSTQYATKAEHDRLSARVDKLTEESEQRIVRLHERIDALDDAIADTPAKTIELLKATKGLL